MQEINEESLNESVKSEQSPRVVLWEIDLTVQGGERYFFCNELNEKGEPVTWQGRQYQAYPIDGSGFEMNGKGSSARPSLTVSNLFGLVTGMAEDLQSLMHTIWQALICRIFTVRMTGGATVRTCTWIIWRPQGCIRCRCHQHNRAMCCCAVLVHRCRIMPPFTVVMASCCTIFLNN